MKEYIKNNLRNKLLVESINNLFIIGNENDQHTAYENQILKYKKKQLNEGLIKTYPLNFVIQRLSQYGTVKLIQNKIYLQLKNTYFSSIPQILKYINILGYFIAQYKILNNGKEISANNYIDYQNIDTIDINSINQLWLVIEPKFDQELTETPEFIYHLTEKKYLNKIKLKGLIPKSKAKKAYHPDRLYVVNNIYKLKDLISNFIVNDSDINEYAILKIDYGKANSPKLYNDPNYLDMGFYIIDNISPDAIIDVIDVNEII